MAENFLNAICAQVRNECEPWIVWEKRESVQALKEEIQTDGRYVKSGDMQLYPAADKNVPNMRPQINCRQYLSVMNRINAASGRAGSYSSWNTPITS